MEHKNIEYPNVFQNYQEISVLNPKPFYHSDLKSSLENIVFKNEPENEKNILGTIFSDKSKNHKATVKALLYEIQLRENLDTHLLKNIDNDFCWQNTYL